jgi:hypothetical protein
MDAIQREQGRLLRRVVLPVAARDAVGVAPRGEQRIAHAAGGTGNQSRTPCFTAPRRSISLRWKKWLVSGIFTRPAARQRGDPVEHRAGVDDFVGLALDQ